MCFCTCPHKTEQGGGGIENGDVFLTVLNNRDEELEPSTTLLDRFMEMYDFEINRLDNIVIPDE